MMAAFEENIIWSPAGASPACPRRATRNAIEIFREDEKQADVGPVDIL